MFVKESLDKKNLVHETFIFFLYDSSRSQSLRNRRLQALYTWLTNYKITRSNWFEAEQNSTLITTRNLDENATFGLQIRSIYLQAK